MDISYKKDIFGKDILCNNDETHQIMMEWEKPYMERSIEKLNPYGTVLEIGFGLGYSATKICSFDSVVEYSVIECTPIVWEKFEEFKKAILLKRPKLKINLIKGRWEDVLRTTGKFDCLYFDDYIIDGNQIMNDRFSKFLYKVLISHTKIGSKICFYSSKDCGVIFKDIGCIETEYSEYNIKIPKNCVYAKGDKMFIPVMTKIAEVDIDLKDKLLKLSMQEKMHEQIKKANEHFEKHRNIYCNLLIIDNFYINALDTRKYILSQEFKVRGNYPGQRTISYANQHLKEMIEGYIQHFAGKITKWPIPVEGDNSSIYNGAYQYTTSRDRTWIHTDGWNNWAGVLYMTPNAPVNSGTGIFRFKDGTRTVNEAEARGNKGILDAHSQDYTKWELVDKVGNVFNRLVLFNSKQYHASLDYFGTNKENGRLFQVFFFSTEK